MPKAISSTADDAKTTCHQPVTTKRTSSPKMLVKDDVPPERRYQKGINQGDVSCRDVPMGRLRLAMCHEIQGTFLNHRYRSDSMRFPWWDYAGAGWYFVTICTQHRQCVLGEIVEGSVRLSPAGLIVEEEWRRTATVRPDVRLDEFAVMPNHVHAIVVLTGDHKKTSHRDVSTKSRLPSQSLGAIIGQFKSVCTKRIVGQGFPNLAGRRVL
jgi:putative transposase